MTLFFVGGIALLLTPGVMVFCQDAALRQQMCEGAHSFTACVSKQALKLFKNVSGEASSTSTGSVASAAAGTPSGKVARAGHLANFSPDSASAAGKSNPASKNNPAGSPASTSSAAASGNPSSSDMANNVSMVDQAVSLLTAQIAKEPNNPSLHNRLGLIYASVGELHRAESQFNLALDSSKEQLADLNRQLAAKKEEGQIAQASQIMLSANQMELELSSAHSNLARVFEKLGQQSKVVAQLDQLNKDVVIGDGPTNAPVAAAPVIVAPVASVKSADGPAAKKVSLELVANLAKAQALLQAGRIGEATTQLRAVLAIDPGLSEAHEQLGTIALASGNVAQAIEELTRARTISPNKATIHAALGVAYQYKGKLKDAIAEFNRALALSPKDSSTLFNLGNAYAATGKNNEATSCYQKAVAISPNMAVAHNNLGSLYSLRGNNEAAEKEFESALSLAPGMYSAHYGLGLAFYRTQEYAAASREFKAALTLNPSLVDAHHKIAMCERQAGPTPKHLYQDVAMR